MATRFPNNAKIRQILAVKVRSNVRAIANVPEAFPFLVNEQTVRDNIPELKVIIKIFTQAVAS